MAVIINGKQQALIIKQRLKNEVDEYKLLYKRSPNLTVILVGNDPASLSYVKGKEKASLEVGIENTTIILDSNVKEEELIDVINELNNDDNVDGILVQLPLPKHINKNNVINAIKVDKDVDGFTKENVARLWLKQPCMIPCTPKGIITLLDSNKISLDGKNVVVMGRSDIVGMPVAKLLLDRNATVTIVHSHTKNVKEITNKADILIVAIGRALYVDDSFIKEGCVVIDVGVNRDTKTMKLCGDCDFESINKKASYTTKVPGGVGPMTIASLMENTILAYLEHMKQKVTK